MEKCPHHNTIGILYPGEMGVSVGKLLSEAGFRVITTVEGRSPRTNRLCCEAGLSAVDSLDEVLRHSDLVISLVSPGAALSVARNVAAHMEGSARTLLYVDANSISPMTVTQISEALRHVPVDFVDASIFVLASQLRQRGILYLSGLRARELAEQFGPFLRVKTVGDAPGQASTLKLIISGMTKGWNGLFVEQMLLAQKMHLLNEALEICDESYPGIMEVIRRLLPTYPQHARRRCEELQEIEATMLTSGLTPRIVRAVREVISAVAHIDWPQKPDTQLWSVPEIIMQIHNEGALYAFESHSNQSPEQPREHCSQSILVGRRSAG